jgi:replication-associated recombination protein RarA
MAVLVILLSGLAAVSKAESCRTAWGNAMADAHTRAIDVVPEHARRSHPRSAAAQSRNKALA